MLVTQPLDPPLTRPVRIWPLGDSITEGYQVPGGYRILLWQLLADGGRAIEFAGSLEHGPATLPDRRHEGHSGWRIDQVLARADGWVARAQPDAVLLLLGTNDMAQNYAVETAPDRLRALLDVLFARQPGVRVLVGTIPPIAEPVQNARVLAYNRAVADLVAAEAARDRPVALVDLYPLVDWAELPDGYHPERSAHDKMARAWAVALEPVLRSLTGR